MSIKVGDRVRLIDWDEAIHRYGDGNTDHFHTPCGLYVPCEMAEHFGKVQVVYAIHEFRPQGDAVYFSTEASRSKWTFSSELITEEALVPEVIAFAYDEFFNHSQTNE